MTCSGLIAPSSRLRSSLLPVVLGCLVWSPCVHAAERVIEVGLHPTTQRLHERVAVSQAQRVPTVHRLPGDGSLLVTAEGRSYRLEEGAGWSIIRRHADHVEVRLDPGTSLVAWRQGSELAWPAGDPTHAALYQAAEEGKTLTLRVDEQRGRQAVIAARLPGQPWLPVGAATTPPQSTSRPTEQAAPREETCQSPSGTPDARGFTHVVLQAGSRATPSSGSGAEEAGAGAAKAGAAQRPLPQLNLPAVEAAVAAARPARYDHTGAPIWVGQEHELKRLGMVHGLLERVLERALSDPSQAPPSQVHRLHEESAALLFHSNNRGRPSSGMREAARRLLARLPDPNSLSFLTASRQRARHEIERVGTRLSPERGRELADLATARELLRWVNEAPPRRSASDEDLKVAAKHALRLLEAGRSVAAREAIQATLQGRSEPHPDLQQLSEFQDLVTTGLRAVRD